MVSMLARNGPRLHNRRQSEGKWGKDMAGGSAKDVAIMENRGQLVAYIESGCTPRQGWRIGTEHEKFGFCKQDCSPLPYEGDRGVRTMLIGMEELCDWKPVFEGENIIALECPKGGSITLEPGGQFELSGEPLENIHQTCCEVMRHLEDVRKVAEPLDIGFLGMGFSPKWKLDEIPLMPKGRYDIMRAYMPKVGSHWLDMMFRSATVQVNLDFESERDMVRKFRASLALQPLASALLASSPFTEGNPNGFLSYRSHIWLDVDKARTGMLPFVFEDGFGFERYVDYALDVPMYFVYRQGRYIDASGQSFRDFLEGRLPALPGEKPTFDDWENHLTTLFPEVRLKRYMEMRGADSGRWRKLCALPALWTGILYDDAALEAALSLIRDWSAGERQELRESAPRLGFNTPFRKGTILPLVRDMLEISRQGLSARARRDESGNDETIYLGALEERAEEGRTRAERLLELYNGEWEGDIDRIFREEAY
jgi:glutamate--cysteine ligase